MHPKTWSEIWKQLASMLTSAIKASNNNQHITEYAPFWTAYTSLSQMLEDLQDELEG